MKPAHSRIIGIIIAGLSILFIWRIDRSRSINPAITPEETPTEHLAGGRDALMRWRSRNFTSFESVNNSPNIKEKFGRVGILLSYTQRSKIRQTIDLTLLMIRAKTFEDYEKSYATLYGEDMAFTSKGRIIIARELLNVQAIDQVSDISDRDLLETYWIITTRLGSAFFYFEGICLDDSYYTLSRQEQLPPKGTFPDPFPKDREAAGYIARESSYKFASNPSDEISENGNILLLDVRFLIATSNKTVAYPICFRFWWDSRTERWLPWYCVEYNSIVRKEGIIF